MEEPTAPRAAAAPAFRLAAEILGGPEVLKWELKGLLDAHEMLLPSAVSSHSWNLIFAPSAAAGRYALRLRERFALDTRLHPAV